MVEEGREEEMRKKVGSIMKVIIEEEDEERREKILKKIGKERMMRRSKMKRLGEGLVKRKKREG